MKSVKNNKGFTLMEIIIVMAIMAVLAVIAIPSYNYILERSHRAVDLDNAQAIVSCLNAHNQAAKADSSISPIMGEINDNIITLSGVDTDGNAIEDIDTVIKFNSVCENKISLLTDDDYEVAIEYVTILSPSDEFTLKQEYTHR